MKNLDGDSGSFSAVDLFWIYFDDDQSLPKRYGNNGRNNDSKWTCYDFVCCWKVYEVSKTISYQNSVRGWLLRLNKWRTVFNYTMTCQKHSFGKIDSKIIVLTFHRSFSITSKLVTNIEWIICGRKLQNVGNSFCHFGHKNPFSFLDKRQVPNFVV